MYKNQPDFIVSIMQKSSEHCFYLEIISLLMKLKQLRYISQDF